MILVTGFKPFNSEKINPTEKLIDDLCRRQKSSNEYLDVHSLVLPVSFHQAPALLQNTINEINPSKVLMLGQAGGSANIRLERVALNWQESSFADEVGYKPVTSVIEQDGESAYFTDFDLSQIKASLISKKIPVEISLSAGSFVCNYLYYNYFKNNKIIQPRPSGLFVHFPFLREQVVGNKVTAFLDWEVQLSAFYELLDFFKK